MKRIFVSIIIILCLTFSIWILLNFITTQHHNDENSNKVFVTNYALESIVNIISGNTLDVTEVYDFTKEVHSESSLTSEQMQAVLDGDYLFCLSEQYEPYLQSIIEASQKGETELKIIKMEDYIGNGKLVDEHIWISPKEGLKIVEVIYENLPASEEDKPMYEENYKNLVEQLEKLNREYSSFAKQNNKTIYVEHDAYYWLREDYDLDIKGISGSSHDSEPSSQDLEAVIKNIEENDIDVIFNENEEKLDDHIKMIQNETDVEVLSLNNMEIKSDLTYVECLEQNLETMKRV